MNKNFALSVLVTSAIFGAAVPAQAAYVANVTETAQGVAFDGSGTINTSAWVADSSGNYNSVVGGSAYIVFGGPIGAQLYRNPVNFSGPASIGVSTQLVFLPSGPGDKVGLEFSEEFLFTPLGYQSGGGLAGSTVQLGATFASLGLTPGTYEWTWGDGASADSYRLNIGANAVPVPAAAWLFGSALIGLAGFKRKSKAS